MKILLVQCPCSYGVEMPPLGLAYLSSFLKKYNYEVSILELSVALYERVDAEYKKYWESNQGYCWYLKEVFDSLPFIDEDCYNEFVGKILSLDSDILGFSIQNTSVLFTLEVIKRIKSIDPSKKIILGGPNCYNVSGDDADFRLHHDLQEFADVVVIGEGERTLLNLLRLLESGEPLDGCKGIATPRDGRWVFNGLAEPVENLDDLPFPDFDAYNLKPYIDKNTLPILTSRGCAMRCIFCTDTYFWGPYRHRRAEGVIEEIIERQRTYGNRSFSFNDSLINGSHRNLMELCDSLANKRLEISWGGNCRVDKRLDLSSLKKLKRAGCNYLILGIESGSDKILHLMRKGFTIEEAERFIRDCNRVGIDIVANWIVGFPGETDEDFKKTVRFILRNKGRIKRNTFSSLTINQFSYLEKHKEEFGITLNGPHLGLWKSKDGVNTIELRDSRLQYLEDIEGRKRRDYNIVRQTAGR